MHQQSADFSGVQRNLGLWGSAALTLLVWVAVLWGFIGDMDGVRTISGLLFLLWLGVNFPVASRAERLFVAFSALLTGAAFFVLGPSPAIFGQALERAALFFGFSMALNLLRDAASGSRAIERSGRYLIGKPA